VSIIQLLMVGGASGAVAISNQSVFDVGLFPEAQYGLLNDGRAYYSTSTDGTSYISGEWLVSGAASGFEARVTVQSGALSVGTAGTWLGLGTSRAWGVSGANGSADILVEIRETGGSVLDTATVTLTSDTF
jgi:hypothetical protein